MNTLRETKHIRGLAKVLTAIANEADKLGYFDRDARQLLKKLGSDVVFKGASLDFTQEGK